MAGSIPLPNDAEISRPMPNQPEYPRPGGSEIHVSGMIAGTFGFHG